MAKRRRVLMGMGALVFGSGAMSVNAAFNNSVNPTGDMRVVADDQLVVEPGIMFRDGSQADAPVDPGVVGSYTGGSKSVNLFEYPGTDFFGGINNSGLAQINTSDLPAAGINDDVNGGITFQTAVKLGSDDQVGDTSAGALQVRNTTSQAEDIAIRYSSFGDDVGDPSGTATVTEPNAAKIFKFKDGKNDNVISPDPTGPSGNPNNWELADSNGDQHVKTYVNVGSGETVQIYLDYDTSDDGGSKYTQLESAVSTGGSGFSTSSDTVQLVETLEVGIEDGSDSTNSP